MMRNCISKKIGYTTEEQAEDALIESWVRYNYSEGSGPVAVYKCDDCKEWHFTSQGEMNEKLARALAEGEVKRRRDVGFWEDGFKR